MCVVDELSVSNDEISEEAENMEEEEAEEESDTFDKHGQQENGTDTGSHPTSDDTNSKVQIKTGVTGPHKQRIL